MNRPSSTYRQSTSNATHSGILVGYTFARKDPRQGWRTPLNNIKYSEQRDEETDLSYFGARYYDSDLTTGWLSVGPMAKGGQSNHNFGLAFDIAGITKGKLDYNLDWDYLSKLGEFYGFQWGGNFKSIQDKPHFEIFFGKDLKELQSLPKDVHGLPILQL